MAKTETVATFEEAVDKMYAAGIKHLHRPSDPWDPYFTLTAVRAWASERAQDLVSKGIIVIKSAA